MTDDKLDIDHQFNTDIFLGNQQCHCVESWLDVSLRFNVIDVMLKP